MKSCRQFLILLFILSVGPIFAQSARKDSITFHYDSLANIKLNKVDSSKQRINNQIDLTQSRINNLFSQNLNQLILKNKISQPVGKIEGAVNEKLNLMNKERGAGANLPTNASLPDVQLTSTSIPNASLPDTQLKANNPLGKIDNPLEEQMGKTGIVNEKITESKGIPQEQIGKVKSIDKLQSVQSKLGEANVITDKAQGIYEGRAEHSQRRYEGGERTSQSCGRASREIGNG